MKVVGGHFAPVKVVNLNWNWVVNLTGICKYIAKQIALKDKYDPISGFFRYLSYLTAFTGLIQFVLAILLNKP